MKCVVCNRAGSTAHSLRASVAVCDEHMQALALAEQKSAEIRLEILNGIAA